MQQIYDNIVQIFILKLQITKMQVTIGRMKQKD